MPGPRSLFGELGMPVSGPFWGYAWSQVPPRRERGYIWRERGYIWRGAGDVCGGFVQTGAGIIGGNQAGWSYHRGCISGGGYVYPPPDMGPGIPSPGTDT